MGSSPSVERKIEAQEAYVKNHFTNAKNFLSQLQFENYPKYNDNQIKMKLRQDFHNHSNNNEYIMTYDWKNYKNHSSYTNY